MAFDIVGDKVFALLGVLGDIFAMMADAVWSTGAAIVHRRFSWAEFIDQTWFLISVTVLPAILIAIPFGLVLVLEVGGLSVQIGATAIVGAVDAIGIVREAAPVITAIILSGAGGSAICSDLGARTMRDEIDAMWVMAVDPVERLVAPRLLATVVVALLVNGVVAFAGILSGYLAAVFILHTSAGGLPQLVQHVRPAGRRHRVDVQGGALRPVGGSGRFAPGDARQAGAGRGRRGRQPVRRHHRDRPVHPQPARDRRLPDDRPSADPVRAS